MKQIWIKLNNSKVVTWIKKPLIKWNYENLKKHGLLGNIAYVLIIIFVNKVAITCAILVALAVGANSYHPHKNFSKQKTDLDSKVLKTKDLLSSLYSQCDLKNANKISQITFDNNVSVMMPQLVQSLKSLRDTNNQYYHDDNILNKVTYESVNNFQHVANAVYGKYIMQQDICPTLFSLASQMETQYYSKIGEALRKN